MMVTVFSLCVRTDHRSFPHGQRDRERKRHRFLDRLPTAGHGVQQEQDQKTVMISASSSIDRVQNADDNNNMSVPIGAINNYYYLIYIQPYEYLNRLYFINI